MTRTPSRSTTSGRAASTSWSGAARSASRHTRARAAARACVDRGQHGSGRRRGQGGDRAGRPWGRTPPGRTRPARRAARATSARQSPPSATATARSSSTFAGSWIARGLRHGASARRQAVVQTGGPDRLDQQHPPACDTAAPRARRPGPADTARYASPWKVLLALVRSGPSASPIVPGQEHFPVHATQQDHARFRLGDWRGGPLPIANSPGEGRCGGPLLGALPAPLAQPLGSPSYCDEGRSSAPWSALATVACGCQPAVR